jgi:hypothetical protein
MSVMGNNLLESEKSTFCIVTAKEVVLTERFSWKFIFDSKLDWGLRKKFGKSNWGHLINTKENMQGEVIVNVFNNENEIIFSWGDKSFTKEWLHEVLEENLPSCAILMPMEYAEIFKALCDEMGVEYHYHYFDGVIKTY